MNYLDELKALYPTQDALGQRYLLTHLSGLPLGLDSDALLEFLWGETASPAVTLAHQARRELGRVLPAALRQMHGLEEGRMGVWSAYHGGGTQSLEQSVAAEDAATGAALRGAGWHALAGSLDRAIGLIRSASPRVWQAASLVAGRFHTVSSLDALAAGLRATAGQDGPSFALACALAELGSEGGWDVLLEAARAHGGRKPDLIQLIADLPVERTLPVLTELAPNADSHGGCAIAQALAGDRTFAGRDLLARLMGRRKGWVTAYALDALAATPRPEDVRLAWDAYRNERHDFLRVQAAKVLGALPSPETVERLTRVLAEPNPRLQAAALEGLARQRADVKDLVPQLVPMLESPLLRLRVNAMLVLGRQAPEPVRIALEKLLFSDQAVQRVEAAFVLGYLRSPSSAGVLEHLALDDPAYAVRVQAIKSLAKQEGGSAVPRLAAVLTSSDARLVTLGARALASVEEPALAQAIQALSEAVPKVASPGLRGVTIRAVGLCASRRDGGAVPPLLLDALNDTSQPVLLGALEGLKGLAAKAAAPRLKELLGHDEPRVRHRAAVAAFLGGELSATLPVYELLGATDERLVLAGVNALLEMATLMPVALPLPRFDELRRALELRAASQTVTNFMQTERPVEQVTAVELKARARRGAPLPATSFEPVAAPKVDLAPAGERLKTGGRPAPRPADAEELARDKVELTTYLVGLASLSPRWRQWLRTYRPLLLIPAVLAIPALMTFREMKKQDAVQHTAGPVKPPAGSLKVSDLKGKAARESRAGNGPLAARTVIAPGDRVATEPGGKMMLGDGAGDSVFLGELSKLTLGQPASDATTPALTPFVFTDPEGDVYVDFRKVKAVELVMGSTRVQSAGGTFRVRTVPAKTVAVASGTALLLIAGQPPKRLSAGDEAAIP